MQKRQRAVGVSSYYNSTQARHLQSWISDQDQEQVTREEIELKALEMAMTGIGLFAGAVVIVCSLALVAHWYSPWAVVAISLLAAAGIWFVKKLRE